MARVCRNTLTTFLLHYNLGVTRNNLQQYPEASECTREP